jgi:hypothetical protein
MKTFQNFGDDSQHLDSDEVSALVFLPTSWHTITARFVRSPVAPRAVELSVWDEDGDHRESLTLRRVDVLLLEDLLRQVHEFIDRQP